MLNRLTRAVEEVMKMSCKALAKAMFEDITSPLNDL